jgi:circadian clock protein KaiC
VAGSAGCGKTINSMEFRIKGIMNGEPSIYITFEEKKNKTYEDMLAFGWDLKKYEEEGKFVFLEYSPEQVKKVLVEGGGIVEAIIEKIKAKRIVIDSITSFSLLYQDELTKKEAALSLFELINKWDCTAILTSQSETRDDEAISTALEFEVDGIIVLYHVKKKGIRTRAVEILKMRGTKIPEKTFKMDIAKGGIVVNLNEVIDFT